MGLSCFLGLDFVASSIPVCGVGAGSVGVVAATQSVLGMCLIFGGVDVHACTQSNTPSILFRRPATLISFLNTKKELVGRPLRIYEFSFSHSDCSCWNTQNSHISIPCGYHHQRKYQKVEDTQYSYTTNLLYMLTSSNSKI